MRWGAGRASGAWSALALCAVVACGGCASGFPNSIPVGQPAVMTAPGPPIVAPSIVAPPPTPLAPPVGVAPGPIFGGFLRSVELSPAEAIAPVGTEVVMIAGVCGQDGYLQARQRVEWMIDQGGVGEFVEVGRRELLDWLLAAHTWPRKIDNTFAIGLTSSAAFNITRGTAATTDDVPVLRGQAWSSITSAVEGISYVTAVAPDVAGWGARQQTATIHWVDAQWSFPPPAINPIGSRHVFTTSVSRHTDQSPVAGWLVRYEIIDGPAAGFAPDGATTIEVPTDAAGQASAEIFQPQPAGGTNNVSVQIVRPAIVGGGRRLIVGNGATTATWSAPQIAVRVAGPATAAVGGTASYQIEISNPGDLSATDITVTSQIPQGATFVGSNPAAQPAGGQVQWTIASLGAGQAQVIGIDLRGDVEGTLEVCADVTAAAGLNASDCITTNFAAAALDVAMIGPGRATVGDEVTFEVTVTNHGAGTATGLVAVSRYDVGLRHPAAASPLERTLDDLQPGQSITFGITFRVENEGELCNAVEIFSGDALKAQTRECLTAVAAPPAEVPSTPPNVTPNTPPVGPGVSALTVRMSGPDRGRLGETAMFDIVITNTGTTSLSDVTIIVNHDVPLEAARATAGNERVGRDLSWRIPTLAAGEPVRYQVEYNLLAASPRACSRVTVTSTSGARADDARCLAIDPLAAELEVSVNDLNDPIAVGNRTVYEVRVTNRSPAPDQQVVLSVTIPDQLRPLNVGTEGPASSVRSAIRGQTVTFEPLAELRAEETVTYRIAAQAVSAGETVAGASVTSQRATRAVTATATTTVFAEP